MTRGSVVKVLPLVAFLVIASWPDGLLAHRPEQQTFKAGTNLVVVPVVVVDGRGATVAGLTAGDFRVEEDGKPIAIESFVAPRQDPDSPGQSRFIILALDNLSTAAEHAYRVKNIANRFVDKLGPYDVMSVIAISGGKAVTTNSRAELQAAISTFSVSAGAEIMEGWQRAEHGLKMISALTEQVVKAPHPRKVMVFIGNANMFSPATPAAFGDADALGLMRDWTDAIGATARNNVSVYVIDPRGPTGPYGDWSKSFAEETGGYAWARTSNFAGATDQIFRESASYYLIGYTPPINDNRLHTINVKVERTGVTVRARRARR
jgi:VWFA-related protein